MADQKSSIPAPNAGLSIFLLVMFANLFARQMSPNRFSGTAVPNTNPSGLQQTPSQLWRDPLGVTYAAMIDYSATAERPVKDAALRADFFPSAPVSVSDVSKFLTPDLKHGAPRPPGFETRILMVIVPGSPFPESQETRLQTRYAVATALSFNGHVPEDPGNLGICLVKDDSIDEKVSATQVPSVKDDSSCEKTPATLVPFEFYRSQSGSSRVLVAWIDDNVLRKSPLQKLCWLTNKFINGANDDRPQCTVIGPPDSDLLNSIADGVTANVGETIPFNLISPWATVQSIVDRLKGENGGASRLKFESTTGNDDDLVDLLAEELKLRLPRYFTTESNGFLGWADKILHVVKFVPPIVPTADERATLDVALVYEGESSYGRQWYSKLSDALKRHVDDSSYPRLRDGIVPNISTSMQYFRGIEGVDARDPSLDAKQLPKSSGSSQLDYVRRLSLELEGSRLSAIGILGAQVEDKLAIIHELRPKFPDAVFFTTDLDARLLPQTAGRDTMNLIVASQYGLEAPARPKHAANATSRSDGRSGSDDVFPESTSFRSTYQVSTYLAVCSALGKPRNANTLPQVFEIGRTAAHPLAKFERLTAPPPVDHVTRVTAKSAGVTRKKVPTLTRIDPTGVGSSRTWLFQSSANLFGTIAALFILAVCVMPHRGLLRTALEGLQSYWKNWRLLACFVICVAALSAHLVYLGDLCMNLDACAHGQPLFFTEGISPWPTMGLHALGTIVAVFGLFFAFTRIVAAKNEIASDKRKLFGSMPGSCEIPELRKTFRRFRRLLDWRRLSVLVTVLVVGYYAVTGLMFRLIGNEIPPTRSIDVLVADRWYLFWAIIPFLTSLFLALVVSVPTHLLLEKLRSTVAIQLRSASRPDSTDASRKESASIALAAMDITRHVTRNIGSLIWTPSAALFLLFVSRSTLFTRWTWPPALVVTFLVCALLILVVSSHVRSSAHRLRNELVQILGRIRATTSDTAVDRLIQNTVSYMTAERSGAFAPLLDHPLVQAGLLPILGLMLSSTLDLLPRFLGAS